MPENIKSGEGSRASVLPAALGSRLRGNDDSIGNDNALAQNVIPAKAGIRR
jgi:hypothetical protein